MGKKYTEKAALVEKGKKYGLSEAVKKVKEISYAKFDETVEMVMVLGIDIKKSDQQVRGTVQLPNGLGKKITVAIVTTEDKFKDAKEADIVGAEDLIEKIDKGFTDFDVLLATPNIMSKVGRLGKVLGRKGLMPTPKAGTVVQDVAKAVKEFKAGKVEFKADKFGIVHLSVGKVSFNEEKLAQNIKAVYDSVLRAKPATSKGIYVKRSAICLTMGPSITLDTVIGKDE